MRLSRDPRLKKQMVFRESKQESQYEAVDELESCRTAKKVSKLSIVEYKAREAVGKANKGKERKNSGDKAALENLGHLASVDTSHAGQATPGGKRKRCHGDEQSVEMLLMRKSVDEALNHQDGSKQAECPERASFCEESVEEGQQEECGAKVERMLAELVQLSNEMEEEKEKSRRLHQENENLDIELELILERLK